MLKKLRAVAVDDNKAVLSTLTQMCKESALVELVNTFTNPNEFLEQAPMLEFDLCLLDIEMPQMEGTTLAQILGNKPIIFISGSDEKFRDALNLSPVDIVPKPIMKDRLNKAFEKACNLFAEKKEYELFNVAESNKKVKIRLGDIMLITTDDVDPRHKQAWMKNGEKYTLMNCKIEHLTANSPSLVQVNRAEAVSLEAVHEVEHDLITLKGVLAENGRPKQVTLGVAFKKKFKERMFYS
ncbi:MAG TPA: response regulator [Bacteroidia bacterium]|nr:response regulator [Bacteroidia bacterium]